jgi:hypothetical protein
VILALTLVIRQKDWTIRTPTYFSPVGQCRSQSWVQIGGLGEGESAEKIIHAYMKVMPGVTRAMYMAEEV